MRKTVPEIIDMFKDTEDKVREISWQISNMSVNMRNLNALTLAVCVNDLKQKIEEVANKL